EARAARPVVLRQRVGQHGDEREIAMLLLPLARQVRKVQVRERTDAPIQHHRSRYVVMERVFDHGFDRREAGAAGEKYDRLVRFLAQEKRAERALEAQDFPALELHEQLIGEKTARHVPDVEVEQRIVFRRRGDGKAAPAAVLEQEIQVLPGQVLKALVGGKLERYDGDVLRDLDDLFDSTWELADLYVADAAHLAHLHLQIRSGPGDAQQRQTLLLLE